MLLLLLVIHVAARRKRKKKSARFTFSMLSNTVKRPNVLIDSASMGAANVLTRFWQRDVYQFTCCLKKCRVHNISHIFMGIPTSWHLSANPHRGSPLIGTLGLRDCAKLVTDSWCCCSCTVLSQLCMDTGACDCTEGEIPCGKKKL